MDERRRILLIDRNLQFQFIGWWIVIVVIGGLIVLAGYTYIQTFAFQQDEWLTSTYGRSLAAVLPPLAMAVVLVTVWAMFTSHRIAGPAYRLKQILKSVAEGNLTTPIQLRTGDYLNDVADMLTMSIASLRGFVVEDRKKLLELQEILQDISVSLEDQEASARLQMIHQKLGDITQKFTI